jgi:hypothetical protein
MIMIAIRTLRDLAVVAGGVAITALAVQELDRPARPAAGGTGLPATRHGWLCQLDGLDSDRPRRIRPATAAEAAASAASRAAGDGGWIAVTSGGQILALDDPAVLAGAGRYYSATDRVDVVYVDTTGRPAGSILAAAPATAENTGPVLPGEDEDDSWELEPDAARVPSDPVSVTGAAELLDEVDQLLAENGEQTDHADVPAGEAAEDYAHISN